MNSSIASESPASGRLETPAGESVPAMWVPMGAALFVRLATMIFLYQDRLDPSRGHWRFAWEMGMVARSLATGKGFASPFPPDTGPTAWLSPLYPALMAAIFHLFGLFSRASAIALLSLNCLLSALTCLPVYYIARRAVGDKQARCAVWIWAFFPYAIYVSAGRIWENALTTFLLACLVWLTLVLEERGTPLHWAGYGALWAIAAYSSASVLSILPFLGLWIAWRRHRRRQPWLARAAVGAVVFLALVMPWQVRNYRTFHKLVPFRDNFWMEVRVGNTGDLSDIYVDWAHPGRSPRELAAYQQLGETAYLERMKQVSLDYIRRYPGAFAGLTVRRFVLTWFGFWSWDPVYRANEPFQLPNTIFCTTMTVLMLIGWRWLWCNRREWAPPFLIALAVFPLVYYVTHTDVDYRHPIDPLIVVLIAAGVTKTKDLAHHYRCCTRASASWAWPYSLAKSNAARYSVAAACLFPCFSKIWPST